MHRHGSAVLLVLCASLFGLAGCGKKALPIRTYPLGEKVVVGRLVYSAFDTQWLTQIGKLPDDREPQNRFFLVRVKITNAGGDMVAAPNLSVVDDAGNAFEELSDGHGVPQWIGFLRQIDKSDTAQGNLVFDVAPRHYKLRIPDDQGETAAFIDLPLEFTQETPDLGIPGADKK